MKKLESQNCCHFYPMILLFIIIILLTYTVCAESFVSKPGYDDANSIRTNRVYLSGQGRDDAMKWEFYCTEGRNSGTWTTILVPSNWELQDFGRFDYGKVEKKSCEKGKYRRKFFVPGEWAGEKILIVFEGVMTDTEVWINGVSAGQKHQGGFYRFKYDITDLVRFDSDNLLEVTVSKCSSNPSVESAERNADYWVFGGIYRPVYLEVLPAQYIEWMAIDACADGQFSIDVYLQHVTSVDSIMAQIISPQDANLGAPFAAAIGKDSKKITLQTTCTGCKTWTAETPNLYKVKLTLRQRDKAVHTVTERFGFRTIQVRPGDGIYLNGKKIRFKGVNRHCFRPDSGRCLSSEISHEDVRLIKQMNMNAVRMSHYPPDKHFLEACDELGLYVLDELAGWHSPTYETEVGAKLVREMVTFNVNHPCILFWDNGNEGGFNTDLDDDFGLYDPQKRPVLHPWTIFSDIDTGHYKKYQEVQEKLAGTTIFMPTEIIHGLYDGGLGAGLDDYWNLISNSKLSGGLFLWVLADEGVVRADKDRQIDVCGNYAPDGIVGPYHEKEGSFYTIQEIFCPIQITMDKLPADFDGTIMVENHYDFTNLNKCSFQWTFLNFKEPNESDFGNAGSTVTATDVIAGPSGAPGEKIRIKINLPQGWKNSDALYLSAFDYTGKNICSWTWPIKKPADYCTKIVKQGKGTISSVEKDNVLTVDTDNLAARFDLKSGKLIDVTNSGRRFSFGNGPRLAPFTALPSAPKVTHSSSNDCHVLEARNSEGLKFFRWSIYPSGWLKLIYNYQLAGQFDYFGVTFSYPEQKVRSKKWLGKGPYHVWKNRLKGTTLNVWQNNYNDTIPGQSWEYPEFKGYFAKMYWFVLETDEGPITIVSQTEDIFCRVYTPKNGIEPRNAVTSFPDGDISFLHAIAPIGTKSTSSDNLGPQSQKNQADGIYEATLYFHFGKF
jgi:hypothetical protein